MKFRRVTLYGFLLIFLYLFSSGPMWYLRTRYEWAGKHPFLDDCNDVIYHPIQLAREAIPDEPMFCWWFSWWCDLAVQHGTKTLWIRAWPSDGGPPTAFPVSP